MHPILRHSVIFTLILSFIFISCSSDDPFDIPPPDFSSVPEAYEIENLPTQEIEPGVEIIVHEEGLENFEITARDEVSVFLTQRTEGGEIIYSSFANFNENPAGLSVRESGTIQNIVDIRQYSIMIAYSPGLKAGLLGMKEGEQRTIIVSPEKAYQNAPSGLYISQFRDDTIIYDITVSRIFPNKIRE